MKNVSIKLLRAEKYFSVQHENEYGKFIKHQHNKLAISSFDKEKKKKYRPSKTSKSYNMPIRITVNGAE